MMKIPQEVSIGLKRLANPSLVSDNNLERLISVSSRFLANPNAEKQIDFAANTPKLDIIKECYASLICLFIESIRNDVDLESLTTLLKQCKFDGERLESIIGLYNAHKLTIQKSLKQIVSDPPHVLDIRWRLNFCVKSSFSDLEDKAVYYIDLILGYGESDAANKPKIKKITFICTVQHLQELVGKLKAATRQLENIANFAR